MSHASFWGLPTLGGWLSIANCAAWCALAFAQQRSLIDMSVPLIFLVVALTLPLGAPLLVIPPSGTCGGGSKEEFVLLCIWLGLNSFVWGYYLESRINRYRRGNAIKADPEPPHD